MSLNSRTVYIFVRQDISLEDQFIQAGHAIFKMTSRHLFSSDDEGTPRLVGVGVPDTRALNRVVTKLEGEGIPFTPYSDPDFPDLGVTAICTAPVTEEQRALLRNYRLYRSAATTHKTLNTFIPLVAASGEGIKSLPQSCGGSKPEGEPIYNVDFSIDSDQRCWDKDFSHNRCERVRHHDGDHAFIAQTAE